MLYVAGCVCCLGLKSHNCWLWFLLISASWELRQLFVIPSAAQFISCRPNQLVPSEAWGLTGKCAMRLKRSQQKGTQGHHLRNDSVLLIRSWAVRPPCLPSRTAPDSPLEWSTENLGFLSFSHTSQSAAMFRYTNPIVNLLPHAMTQAM